MGKIYVGQTKLDLVVTVGQRITAATTTQLKYQKPDESTGFFDATITDAEEGELTYIVQADDLDQSGTWIFWANVVFSGGKQAFGEPYPLQVHEERF